MKTNLILTEYIHDLFKTNEFVIIVWCLENVFIVGENMKMFSTDASVQQNVHLKFQNNHLIN